MSNEDIAVYYDILDDIVMAVTDMVNTIDDIAFALKRIAEALEKQKKKK